jgi:5-methylcytosine-specific restriction endonuclease McrA
MPCDYSLYPENWKDISRAIRERAGNRCENCGAENHQPHPITGSRVVLTVAHLDHTPSNCDPANLRAWCQKCHLTYDAQYHARHAKQTRAAKREQERVEYGQLRLFE